MELKIYQYENKDLKMQNIYTQILEFSIVLRANRLENDLLPASED